MSINYLIQDITLPWLMSLAMFVACPPRYLGLNGTYTHMLKWHKCSCFCSAGHGLVCPTMRYHVVIWWLHGCYPWTNPPTFETDGSWLPTLMIASEHLVVKSTNPETIFAWWKIRWGKHFLRIYIYIIYWFPAYLWSINGERIAATMLFPDGAHGNPAKCCAVNCATRWCAKE